MTTEIAADKLTNILGVNFPQRWGACHLYQAVLDREVHAKDIVFLTTLSGYIHYRLTGKHVLGVGEAFGMSPLDYRN